MSIIHIKFDEDVNHNYTLTLDEETYDSIVADINNKLLTYVKQLIECKALPDIPFKELSYSFDGDTYESTSVPDNEPGPSTSYTCDSENEDDNKLIAKTWTVKHTKALISVYKENQSLFQSNTIKRVDAWKKVAGKLKSMNISKNAKQCEDKWKNLRKAYIKRKDNKKKTGEATLNFDYEEEFDDIYLQKPNVNPPTRASGSLVEKEVVAVENNGEEPQKKKIKLHKNQEIVDAIQLKEKAKAERHKENIAMQQQAIDMYKAMMDRLLNTLSSK